MQEPLAQGPAGEAALCVVMDGAVGQGVNLSDMRQMAKAILARYEVRPRELSNGESDRV